MDEYTAYDLVDTEYKGTLIKYKEEYFLVPLGEGEYEILDYKNQILSPLEYESLNYKDFPSFQTLIDGNLEFLTGSLIENEPSRKVEIQEVKVYFNNEDKATIYCLSDYDLQERSRLLYIEYLKEHRRGLLSKGDFHSKLAALETIHKELSLSSNTQEDNIDGLALEATIDSFIKLYDEEAGIQLITSGKTESILKREDKDKLNHMQKEYLDLIDSNPNITQVKLKEFSKELFHIHIEGIRQYKKIKGYK